MTLESNITQILIDHYRSATASRAHELLRALGIQSRFAESPMRDAAIILSKELKADYDAYVFAVFPADGLQRTLCAQISDDADWFAIAVAVLHEHRAELAAVPHLWYERLTHDQRAISTWADCCAELYPRRVKLESTTAQYGIAEGDSDNWTRWIHDAYEDYRRVHRHDDDSVILNFTDRLELAYFYETCALFPDQTDEEADDDDANT